MNLLVAGGLLLFGVVALVAVVFVIRSEPATQESISPPSVPTKQGEPETHIIADEPSSSGETPDTPQRETTLIAENHAVNEWQSLANGQLYELKNELRSLHDQAQELEQRLKTIVDMVERIEEAQNGLFPIEDSDTVNTHAAR